MKGRNIMTIEYYDFTLGNFRCLSLLDGAMDYKLEAMVKNAPRIDVEAALKAHQMRADVINTPYAYLLVETGQHPCRMTIMQELPPEFQV